MTRSPELQPWLDRAVRSLPRWPYGEVRSATAQRIGLDYAGSDATILRVGARTAAGEVTFVLKQDTPAATNGALLFHEEAGDRVGGAVPVCHGGIVEDGIGYLFLEDVAGEQGDALAGCADDRMIAVVRAMAGLHAASWATSQAAHAADLPLWEAGSWGEERWTARLSGARDRFPALMTPEVIARLEGWPGRVTDAVEELRRGPHSWIHVDAHLDNVIWRADGSAVLLDWSSAAIGPPAVDLARLSLEGSLDRRQLGERRRLVVDHAAAELRRLGVPGVDEAMLDEWLGLAMLPLIQSIVGWAGKPEESPPSPRMSAMRESAARNTVAWLTTF